jgi:hypothetical protein
LAAIELARALLLAERVQKQPTKQINPPSLRLTL